MPNQLVKYAPRLVSTAYRRMPAHYRAAIYMGSRAYKYRKYGFKLARWGVKKWRTRRSATMRLAKKRRFVGDPPRAPANRDVTLATDTGMSTRTMYAHNVSRVQRHSTGTNTGLPGARNSNVYTLSGFKYCIQMRNNRNKPMDCHIAVVVPKHPDNFAGGIANKTQKFFRAQDGTTRETNFSTQLSSLEFRCLPINSARFHILQHHRFTIGPAEVAGEYNRKNSIPNWVTKEKYVKIGKRKFTFTDSTGDSEQPPVYMILWCDEHDAPANSSALGSASNLQERVVTYFRDCYAG